MDPNLHDSQKSALKHRITVLYSLETQTLVFKTEGHLGKEKYQTVHIFRSKYKIYIYTI